MPWYAQPALWVAIGGVITAVATLVRLIQHQNTPTNQAHPPSPPGPGDNIG